MEYLRRPKVYFILVAIVMVISLSIAWQTRYDAHPDEITHGNGFCYFETHGGLPNLNSDDVYYDSYGASRVYNGELVYILYGRIGGIIRPFVEPMVREIKPYEFNSPGCQPVIEIYRLLNVGLFLATLWIIFKVARQHSWVIAIAATLLFIPQVIYAYSYANDDAWGISFSIFLFLYVASHSNGSSFSARGMVSLAILTGLVILSKQSFWISIPFSYLMLVPNIKTGAQPLARRSVGHFALFIVTLLIIIGPLKIVYPLSQGDFAAKTEQMLEQRAKDDFQPSHITAPGYRLASRGVPFSRLLSNSDWLAASVRSFYGVFGYMNIFLPRGVYGLAGTLLVFAALLTLGFLARPWHYIPVPRKLLLMASPLFIGGSVLVSMLNSWMYDYQPQGRYLFGALIPMALLLGGTADIEPQLLRLARTAIGMILYGLSVYVLWVQAAQNVVLR